jgi:endonuclease III
MGPERKDESGSSDPKDSAAQERSETQANAERLIEEARALREKAKRLIEESDALIERFKREHPDDAA